MGHEPATNELVLRRAFELADVSGGDVDDLTPRQLGEIAAEVGLPLEALARSLAESLARVDDGRGWLDRLVGDEELSGHRSVPRSEIEIDASLVEWLESGHGLRARVGSDGVFVAERRNGLAGSISRGVMSVKGMGSMGRARSVRGATVEVGDDQGALCLVVSVADQRRNAMAGGTAVGAGAGSFSILIGLAFAPVAYLAVPVAVGVGVATSRFAYRTSIASIERELEETLDAIASGNRPPSVLDSVSKGLSRGKKRRKT